MAAQSPMSQLWESGREPLRGFRVLKLGLNPRRAALYEKLNLRAARMFDEGLVEETRMLVDRFPGAWALSSLGYKQARLFLHGELTREQAIAAVQQAHRNYAKRQMTWFRREPEVNWLEGFGDDPEIQRQAIQTVESLREPSRKMEPHAS